MKEMHHELVCVVIVLRFFYSTVATSPSYNFFGELVPQLTTFIVNAKNKQAMYIYTRILYSRPAIRLSARIAFTQTLSQMRAWRLIFR